MSAYKHVPHSCPLTAWCSLGNIFRHTFSCTFRDAHQHLLTSTLWYSENLQVTQCSCSHCFCTATDATHILWHSDSLMVSYEPTASSPYDRPQSPIRDELRPFRYMLFMLTLIFTEIAFYGITHRVTCNSLLDACPTPRHKHRDVCPSCCSSTIWFWRCCHSHAPHHTSPLTRPHSPP